MALLGSLNTTPCDVAATGTTSMALNCKSISLIAAGNNWIVTRAVSISSGKSTSLGLVS